MTSPSPSHFRGSGIYSYFLIALLLFAVYLGFSIASPFVDTIILSGVVAVICSPVHSRIRSRMPAWPNVAAALSVLLLVVVIAMPLFFITLGLVKQAKETASALSAWTLQTDFNTLLDSHRLDPLLEWINVNLPFLKITAADIQARLLEATTGVTQWVVTNGRQLFANTFRMLLHFLLLIFIVFYFLRDGRHMMERIRYFCPLRDDQEDAIILNMQRVARSVLLGSLLIGMLQGLVGGFGLAVAGIPGLFLGALMALSSLIPVVGTGLIWGPAAIWLFIQGQWGWGTFVLIWCGLLVTSIDTLVRPMLLRGAAQLSTFYVLLAVLGGVYTFGATGILYGPLILTFVMVMLRIYGEEYREVLQPRQCVAPKAAEGEGAQGGEGA